MVKELQNLPQAKSNHNCRKKNQRIDHSSMANKKNKHDFLSKIDTHNTKEKGKPTKKMYVCVYISLQ